jgi:hypothetical protein
MEKELKIKTDVDSFREGALVIRDQDKLILAIGHHHNQHIDIPFKPGRVIKEEFVNKYHRKRIANIFKLSGETDFVAWIKTNLIKHLK